MRSYSRVYPGSSLHGCYTSFIIPILDRGDFWMENKGDSDEIPHDAAIHNNLSHISTQLYI